MLTIGAVVLRFSIRYLDDDPNQEEFLKHISLVLTSVLFMLFAQNLLLFFVAWIGSSYFLHQLLTHFKNRSGARKAAAQKFWISRLGDVFLLAAFIVFFNVFQTLDFAIIFQLINNDMLVTANHTPLLIASLSLILGAMVKSAQFPFHYWLPNSMETPTPVSALMHAGIINAGGYLVIRMSPVLNSFPSVLYLLAIIGGVTAFYAAVVMITQTDVKKYLAYSTIAQMGFMMLQCGLGAFALATLHIIGHSFYKAYAFLSAGTATDVGKINRFYPTQYKTEDNLWQQFICVLVSLSILFVMAWFLEVDFITKPGAIILTLILGLAMAQTLMSTTTTMKAVSYASLICMTYFLLLKCVTYFLSGSIPTTAVTYDVTYLILSAAAGSLFVLLYLIQNNLAWLSKTSFGVRLYVALYNGFYWGRS